MNQDLPPFFYEGGNPDSEEPIDFDELPFLPSQAKAVRDALIEAARFGSEPSCVGLSVWPLIKRRADTTRQRMKKIGRAHV